MAAKRRNFDVECLHDSERGTRHAELDEKTPLPQIWKADVGQTLLLEEVTGMTGLATGK
jgi:hypothetical protein